MIEVDRNCRQQGSTIIHNVSSRLFYCVTSLFNSSCICMILDFLNLSVCAFVVLYGTGFLILSIFFGFLLMKNSSNLWFSMLLLANCKASSFLLSASEVCLSSVPVMLIHSPHICLLKSVLQRFSEFSLDPQCSPGLGWSPHQTRLLKDTDTIYLP